MRFIKLLLEAWLGRAIDLPDPVTTDVEAHEPAPIPSEEQVRQDVERVEWGLEVDYSETYHESEETTFASQGRIEMHVLAPQVAKFERAGFRRCRTSGAHVLSES